MNPTPEQLETQYDKIPEDIKEAMFSFELGATLTQIGEAHKLHIDKIGLLGEQVALIMLGLTHPRDFVGNLKSKLEVTDDEAKSITKEINEKVFDQIKESLKQVHHLAGEKGLGEARKEEAGQMFERKMQSLLGGKPDSVRVGVGANTPATQTPAVTQAPRNLQDPYREPLE